MSPDSHSVPAGSVERAHALLTLGRPAEALQLVGAMPGNDLDVGLVRVLALLQLQRSEEARNQAEALVSAHPEDVEPLRLLAHAELARLRRRQATAVAYRALAMAPDDLDVLRTASICSREVGRVHDAVMTAYRMVQIAPDNPSALGTYADALVAQQQFPLAERVARDALAISPNDPDSLTALAAALDGQGRRQEAAVLLAEAGRVDPTDLTVPSEIVTLIGKRSGVVLSVVCAFIFLSLLVLTSRALGPEGAAGAVLAFVVVAIGGYAVEVRDDVRRLPRHLQRALRREQLAVIAAMTAGGSVLAAMFAVPLCAALLLRGETRGPLLPLWITMSLICGWIAGSLAMLRKTDPRFLHRITQVVAARWAERRVWLPLTHYPPTWGTTATEENPCMPDAGDPVRVP